MIAGAAEHDECDEAVRVVEAVGHADGDLDPVVGRLEPGVGAARFDGAWDVGAASPDFFFGKLDDLGDAAMRGPEHPAVQLSPGPVEGEPEQAQRFLEPP